MVPIVEAIVMELETEIRENVKLFIFLISWIFSLVRILKLEFQDNMGEGAEGRGHGKSILLNTDGVYLIQDTNQNTWHIFEETLFNFVEDLVETLYIEVFDNFVKTDFEFIVDNQIGIIIVL